MKDNQLNSALLFDEFVPFLDPFAQSVFLTRVRVGNSSYGI